MKQITFGQNTIILGRGATESKAWTIAREISARRKNWHNVHHVHAGNFHRVTCFEGRDRGHVYRTSDFWWSMNTTIAERAAMLRAAKP